MLKKALRKLLKKDKLIVKKTDNELVRYIKQTNIIEERKRFEELMKQEEERKARGLNDTEKRQLYFQSIEGLRYDKTPINDNEMDTSFLNDKANYRPLGQRWRPVYLKPFYAKPDDFSDKVSHRVWLLRIFGFLILSKVGYEFGVWDGDYVNRQLRKSVVVEFESEEQIYDYLFNKNMTAVLLQLYNPGHWLTERFNRDFEIESSKYV